MFLGLQKTCGPYFNNGVVRDLVTGSLTGIICVAINQPLDVLKTNIQGLNSHRYNGVVDCAKQIVRNEGYSGLYKGYRPRMARVAIEVAVTFASYNVIKDTVLRYLDMAE